MLEGGEPDASNLLLFFTIFAGAAFVWTPELSQKLPSSLAESGAASLIYTRLALFIVENTHQLSTPSVTALAAMCNLAHLLINSNDFIVKVHMLRIRCLVMAREMGIHRLDTTKGRNARELEKCNMIEIQVQRRIWWSMVASDWLAAFSGGPHEGAYAIHPKHMNVCYPSNVDDELIMPTGVEHNFPLSTPTTTMSAFIQRLKLAELCREVVDAMPSMLLDIQEPDYAVILALDKKFHDYIEQLPVFFRLDETSVRQSQKTISSRRLEELEICLFSHHVHPLGADSIGIAASNGYPLRREPVLTSAQLDCHGACLSCGVDSSYGCEVQSERTGCRSSQS
ncbi:putative transcription factor lepB [Hyphodiscus hymeniophilus]|uniref:Transcription factor lepB n=1 Tax=Hyphodiscus hymeniophilus TaxID=353542 RepID=A0A9P6VP06_9HELO|nr:putative transcription factor lepB [Hyphodiscus hymeniophilus]